MLPKLVKVITIGKIHTDVVLLAVEYFQNLQIDE